MDELGKWFLDVFASVNRGGRLGPPAASNKRVEAFLGQIGGEGVMQLSTLLDIGNAEVVRKLATAKPDLGEWLAGDEPQRALDRYIAERTKVFEPYRKFVTRGLSLKIGSTVMSFADPADTQSVASEAWEKVFQVLMGRENDGEESSSL